MWYNSKESTQININIIVAEFLRKKGSKDAESPSIFVQRQRLIKSDSEVNLMRKTCQIASMAINETMRDTKPGR